jgi:hypothetical protein
MSTKAQRKHPSDGGVDTDLFDFEDNEPDDACVNYDECRNEVPGAGLICGECLDRYRHG